MRRDALVTAILLLLPTVLSVHQNQRHSLHRHHGVDPPPKLYERMADLIKPYGYPLEEHFVETVDGYILRMFRIPHGKPQPSYGQHQQSSTNRWLSTLQRLLPWLKASARTAGVKAELPAATAAAPAGTIRREARPVVHMQHGLLGSSTDWVLNGPGLSLPLLLADAGYDVWFGNVRGNIFSRNHTTLELTDALFWSFSWDDMANRDLPAMFTYELMATGAAEISYIGHSQGTTIGMAFMASHADTALAERIKVAVLLAPVAYVTHVNSPPLLTLASFNTDELFILLGFHEFMPSVEVLARIEGEFCKYQPSMCVNILAAICGYNPSNLDERRLPTYVNYTPSGTSVKNMAHWSQAVRQPRQTVMSYFDYGTSCRTMRVIPRPCNQAVYGQLAPPVYNLSGIRNKLVLFTGGQDRLADPLDIELLLETLPPEQLLMRHHEPSYEHLDFIWGINAASRIYSKVLAMLGNLHKSRMQR